MGDCPFSALRFLISIGLAALILSQSMNRIWVIISFTINQDDIARTMCVNRDKPEMHCNGKCYLAKQLKKQQEQDSRELPQKLKETTDVFYCVEPFSLPAITAGEVVVQTDTPPYSTAPVSNAWIQAVFHPPRPVLYL